MIKSKNTLYTQISDPDCDISKCDNQENELLRIYAEGIDNCKNVDPALYTYIPPVYTAEEQRIQSEKDQKNYTEYLETLPAVPRKSKRFYRRKSKVFYRMLRDEVINSMKTVKAIETTN